MTVSINPSALCQRCQSPRGHHQGPDHNRRLVKMPDPVYPVSAAGRTCLFDFDYSVCGGSGKPSGFGGNRRVLGNLEYEEFRGLKCQQIKNRLSLVYGKNTALCSQLDGINSYKR
ncbi:hypothetical protein AVEN_246964-1 [Araneus ventricosus]|uniref:Uncharacterized protein n=1 Tax=Araneus ventricosus TaxID=182803 RepID=A0A4Y2JMM4_ARAVE|nr:hypothetical protein AVEN_246964-1 [Araneus ventricosus]